MKCSDHDDDYNLKATLSSGYKLTKYAIVIIVLNKLANDLAWLMNVVSLKSVPIIICKRMHSLSILSRELAIQI